jgi:hypothetical protein
MSQETGERCTRCLRGTDDVKAVQYKVPGTANQYISKKEHACRKCRKMDRGHWRYWR